MKKKTSCQQEFLSNFEIISALDSMSFHQIVSKTCYTFSNSKNIICKTLELLMEIYNCAHYMLLFTFLEYDISPVCYYLEMMLMVFCRSFRGFHLVGYRPACRGHRRTEIDNVGQD